MERQSGQELKVLEHGHEWNPQVEGEGATDARQNALKVVLGLLSDDEDALTLKVDKDLKCKTGNVKQ